MNPAVTTCPATSTSAGAAGSAVPIAAIRPSADRHILHRVQTRFGIDHPAAAQHQVPVAHRRLLGTSVPGGTGVPGAVGC